MNAVWCKTAFHEAQHLIVNGEAACRTARKERFADWLYVQPDQLDTTKQCCRCKGWLAANPQSSDDHAEKLRAHCRAIGSKGGKASTPAKRRAARARERMKRKHKRACGVVG